MKASVGSQKCGPAGRTVPERKIPAERNLVDEGADDRGDHEAHLQLEDGVFQGAHGLADDHDDAGDEQDGQCPPDDRQEPRPGQQWSSQETMGVGEVHRCLTEHRHRTSGNATPSAASSTCWTQR